MYVCTYIQIQWTNEKGIEQKLIKKWDRVCDQAYTELFARRQTAVFGAARLSFPIDMVGGEIHSCAKGIWN